MRSLRLSFFVFTVISFLTQAALAGVSDELRQRVEAFQSGMPVEAGGTPLLARKALPQYYENNAFQPVWLEGTMLRPEASQFAAAIAESASHGLNPRDYHQGEILALLAAAEQAPSHSLLLDLELLLTDSYLLLGSHYTAGKVNPESIDPEWFANRRNVDMALVLAEAAEDNRLIETLGSLWPAQEAYQRLRNHLAGHRAIEREGGFLAIPEGSALKPGMRDPRISNLRWRLVQSGDLHGSFSTNEDLFDEALHKALIAYQKRHGLAADGVVGRETRDSLNKPVAERIDQILVNLERWRWVPADLGRRHVLVNIAGFGLRAVADDRVVLQKRVIVGRDYRRTPVFSDRISYLVLNPTWTVPRKIAVEDKLPELRRDPAKLVAAGFDIYQGWGDQQKRIDPLSIDWNAVSRSSFNFRLVQRAGPMNALGQVKFMFPNKFDVYLHDTPARELFSSERRAFSSGCVRVERPLELAAFLLAEQNGWTPEKIEEVTGSLQTRTVELKPPVPVHITYWTSWVEEDGTLQFRDDVYGRDGALRNALAERFQMQ